MIPNVSLTYLLPRTTVAGSAHAIWIASKNNINWICRNNLASIFFSHVEYSKTVTQSTWPSETYWVCNNAHYANILQVWYFYFNKLVCMYIERACSRLGVFQARSVRWQHWRYQVQGGFQSAPGQRILPYQRCHMDCADRKIQSKFNRYYLAKQTILNRFYSTV